MNVKQNFAFIKIFIVLYKNNSEPSLMSKYLNKTETAHQSE